MYSQNHDTLLYGRSSHALPTSFADAISTFPWSVEVNAMQKGCNIVKLTTVPTCLQEVRLEPLTVMQHYLASLKAQICGLFIPAKIPTGGEMWLVIARNAALKWQGVLKLTGSLQLLEESINEQKAALQRNASSLPVRRYFQ